jgi:hypothetical protein
MAEFRDVEVKTFIQRAYCECGGDMVYGGICYATVEPGYPHSCKKCGKSQTLDDTFPRKVLKEIE